jgi:hypothetical protein
MKRGECRGKENRRICAHRDMDLYTDIVSFVRFIRFQSGSLLFVRFQPGLLLFVDFLSFTWWLSFYYTFTSIPDTGCPRHFHADTPLVRISFIVPKPPQTRIYNGGGSDITVASPPPPTSAAATMQWWHTTGSDGDAMVAPTLTAVM